MSKTSYLEQMAEVAPDRTSNLSLGVSRLTGNWVNTNKASQGINRVSIFNGTEGLILRITGTMANHKVEEEEIPVTDLFAETLDSDSAMSFTAVFEFGSQSTELQANINMGLLIISVINTFAEGSGAVNVFAREFYYWETPST